MMKAGGTEIGKTLAEKSRGLFSANDWQCKTYDIIITNVLAPYQIGVFGIPVFHLYSRHYKVQEIKI